MPVLIPVLAPPSRKTRRAVVVAAVVVIVMVLLLLRLTAGERLQHWSQQCQAQGGFVAAVEPDAPNPLLVQSGDTGYECRGMDGRVLSTWR